MAKKHTANLVRTQIESYIEWLGDTTVEDLIARLNSVKAEQLDKGFFDLYIEKEYGWGDGDDTYNLIGYRNETPAEKKRRIAEDKKEREHKATQKQKNAERKDKSEKTTYERLKKKFGD